jgi:hypothetical protein
MKVFMPQGLTSIPPKNKKLFKTWDLLTFLWVSFAFLDPYPDPQTPLDPDPVRKWLNYKENKSRLLLMLTFAYCSTLYIYFMSPPPCAGSGSRSTLRSTFPQTSVNQLRGHPKTIPVIDWLHRRRDIRIGGFFYQHSHWFRGFCLRLCEEGSLELWRIGWFALVSAIFF